MSERDRLYDVAADDYELEVLDRLSERAGIVWHHEGCFTNPGDAVTCERCGKPREDEER